MNIKNQVDRISDSKNLKIKLNEVKASQKKAFDMLIHEKLEANESFRIYMELSKEVIEDIKIKIMQIKKN